MNPLKVIIVQPDDSDGLPGGLQIIGAIVWMVLAWMLWDNFNLFDSTTGRICFIPVVILSAIIGYLTTLFLICATIFYVIVGLLLGWIFDFAFFETTFKYIGIFLDYLAK